MNMDEYDYVWVDDDWMNIDHSDMLNIGHTVHYLVIGFV